MMIQSTILRQSICNSSSASTSTSRLLTRWQSSIVSTSRRTTRTRRTTATSRGYASISDPALDDVLDHNHAQAQGLTPAQRAAQANAAPQLNKAIVQVKKERKLAEYANTLKAKALQEGYSSVEEFREAKLMEAAQAVAKAKAEKSSTTSISSTSSQSSQQTSFSTSQTQKESLEERDSRVMREIRARAEAEAKRKLESGELGSGPGGKSPVKPLSEILDISKFSSETPERITELWTGYHTLKNKLSAVIPSSTYHSLISNAKKYPQFVLPLGRKVIEEESESESATKTKEFSTPTEEEIKEKQGFEMQFLEWAFLPHPPSIQTKTKLNDFSSSEVSPIKIEELKQIGKKLPPKPSTVLFTPLAEYKLRQTFAQPVLILTHYIDLIDSHGIVLMRGDITGSTSNEESSSSSSPNLEFAIQEAKNQGKSEKEIQELSKPLQSDGKIGMKEAQILTMMLQRFYVDTLSGMKKLKEKEESGKFNKVDSEEIRAKLLKDFHENPQSFDVDLLIKAAYMI